MSNSASSWAQWETCTQCGLGLTATRRSVGAGNPNAQIMIVADTPAFYYGSSGDCAPTPLGTFLSQMLSIIDLSLENVYFTTLVKCQPYENRHPMATELETCHNHLRQQIAVISPKIIICIGRISGKTLIDKNLNLSKQHGEFVVHHGITLTAIHHPRALHLEPNLRPISFGDLKKIQSKLVELGVKV